MLVGGLDITEIIRRMMATMFTSQFITTYNWSGNTSYFKPEIVRKCFK